MKRFGLQTPPTGVQVEEAKDCVQRREARAKRFGTKLVAARGEPIKLVDRYVRVVHHVTTASGLDGQTKLLG